MLSNLQYRLKPAIKENPYRFHFLKASIVDWKKILFLLTEKYLFYSSRAFVLNNPKKFVLYSISFLIQLAQDHHSFFQTQGQEAELGCVSLSSWKWLVQDRFKREGADSQRDHLFSPGLWSGGCITCMNAALK